MKRSKLFLTITTCCLAVAGIAATKAHQATNTVIGYYSTGNGNGCTKASTIACTRIGTQICRATVTISGSHAVLTLNTFHQGICVQPLQRNGE